MAVSESWCEREERGASYRAIHLDAHGEERALGVVLDVRWTGAHKLREAIEPLGLADEHLVLIYKGAQRNSRNW